MRQLPLKARQLALVLFRSFFLTKLGAICCHSQSLAANECIGKTGTGLNPNDVTPGSDITNLIGIYLFSTIVIMLMRQVLEKEMEIFKWWPRLHGFWRTLHNFNPYTVSSEPGQDLAAEAQSVLLVGGATGGDSRRDIEMVCIFLYVGVVTTHCLL